MRENRTRSLRLAAGCAWALLGCATTQQAAKSESATAPTAAATPAERPADQLFAQGVQQIEAAKYAEAAATFRAVLEKDPKRVSAQFNLGLAVERQGELRA